MENLKGVLQFIERGADIGEKGSAAFSKVVKACVSFNAKTNL